MKKEKQSPRFYRRNLPHIQPKDGVFFITYNLDGSLPKKVLQLLREERDLRIEEFRKKGLSPEEIRDIITQSREFHFGKFDALLDNPSSGPSYLKNPEVAKIVMDSLHWLDGRAYKLVCYTIMSNHVHKIVYNTVEILWKCMKRHKSYTAKKANLVLELSGQFWQHESFDHLIRNRKQFKQKIRYTLNNAVKAGIVKNWEDYPYSWICPEFKKYGP